MRCDKWIVIGGGASGIATSFFLKQRGIDSEIIEGQSAIGGRMGSVKLGNRLLDCGGKNIGRGYALFRQFAAALGAHPFEHFGLNSSQATAGWSPLTDSGVGGAYSIWPAACRPSTWRVSRGCSGG
jgi:oxygen-dependent protoporphyrinogen oxidase